MDSDYNYKRITGTSSSVERYVRDVEAQGATPWSPTYSGNQSLISFSASSSDPDA